MTGRVLSKKERIVCVGGLKIRLDEYISNDISYCEYVSFEVQRLVWTDPYPPQHGAPARFRAGAHLSDFRSGGDPAGLALEVHFIERIVHAVEADKGIAAGVHAVKQARH